MADTALVLGGGGITGIGWEAGMLAGLADAGVDLSTATVVIGTSAGSVVGAQLTPDRRARAAFGRNPLDPARRAAAARAGRDQAAVHTAAVARVWSP